MKLSKIILGAKNTDIEMFKNIITPYAIAGVDIIDVCTEEKVINHTRKIIQNLNLAKSPKLCASITLNNDVHSTKATISEKLCCACSRCKNICPQQAIITHGKTVKIKETRCVGCKKCSTVCPNSAIEFYNENKMFEKQFKSAIIADYIEIHTNGSDKNLTDIFEFLKINFTGDIGICISQCTDINKKTEIIEQIKNIIFPQKLIVQADGNSVSGFDNEELTTMAAIEEAKIYRNIDNIIILLSGGTNAKTYYLAKENNIKFDGISWGTYARKIILNSKSEREQLKNAHYLLKPLTE